MSTKQSVTIRIRGQEFHIRSDDDEASLQRGVLIAQLAIGFDQRRDGPLKPIEIEAVCGCLAF